MYSAQQHYSAVDDKNGGGVIGHYAGYRGITHTKGTGLIVGESEDTLTDLINLIYTLGPESFAKDVVHNETKRLGNSKTGNGENYPFRSQVCLELAQMLLTIAPTSNTLSGLRIWAETVDLEDRTFNPKGNSYVKGVRYATWHYLCMLAGNENLVKPNIHITRFVKCALGYEPTKPEIVRLLQKAAKILGVSSKQLDNLIWNYMRNKGKR